MNLCSDGHDEVCFEGRHCPVCEMRDERDGKQETIIDLNKTIDRLNTEIEDMT